MPDQVPARLADVLTLFGSVASEEERAGLLLEYADQFHEVPPTISTRPFPEDHRVKFCESEAYVWVVQQSDGTLRPYFAVENPSGVSARALAVILQKTLSGSTPEQIAGVPEDIVFQIFRRNISMGKGMGLLSMVQTVKALARRHAKETAPSPGDI